MIFLDWWGKLIDKLPGSFFSPEPDYLPPPPDPEDERFGERIELYEKLASHRKAFHDETSKTIKRVFFTLIGTCLFCVITLAGSSDAELLSPTATVKLPVLNYDISFYAFLIVGPVVLIALTIYLHIFVAQHRMAVIDKHARQPMLPNFDSWAAKFVILIK